MPQAPIRLAVAAMFVLSSCSPKAPTPEKAAAPPPAATPAPPAVAAGDKYTDEQLEALLAPIALYPDELLAQVLMAATYPTEIVAASRWLGEGNNRSLRGPALETALQGQPWDPSVKSLVPFPQALGPMDKHLDWTQQVGYAMQVQQNDVFNSIQRLRAKSQQAGQLKSSPQMRVSTKANPPPPANSTAPPADMPAESIYIEPTNPEDVYVPAYDTNVAYGEWDYATPPVYYPPDPAYYPGYVPGQALATGLMFGLGVAAVAGMWGWARPSYGCCWNGYGGGYGYSNVNVNVNRYNSISGGSRTWSGGANGGWRSSSVANRPGGGLTRPNGPVGRPGGAAGIGRAGGPGGVGGPGGLGGPGRPGGPGGINGPAGLAAGRPGGPGGVGGVGGPGRVSGPGGVERGQAAARPAQGARDGGARQRDQAANRPAVREGTSRQRDGQAANRPSQGARDAGQRQRAGQASARPAQQGARDATARQRAGQGARPAQQGARDASARQRSGGAAARQAPRGGAGGGGAQRSGGGSRGGAQAPRGGGGNRGGGGSRR